MNTSKCISCRYFIAIYDKYVYIYNQIVKDNTCYHQPIHSSKCSDDLRKKPYGKTSNISRTLVGNKIVDDSDVVGAAPVGAAPTTSSFST